MFPDRLRCPSDEQTQRVVREYFADRPEPPGDFRAIRAENLKRTARCKHVTPNRVT